MVGIDNYEGEALEGCVADAVAMAGRLKTHDDGAPNFDIRLKGGDSLVTRDSLRDDLEELFSNSQNCDLVFFFSGHGTVSSFGAELVCTDFTTVGMNDVLHLANASNATSVTLILDCCFSGSLGNAETIQPTQLADQFRRNVSILSEGVSVLAASRATQVSIEADGHGVFTQLLLDGLDGGATDHLGRVTPLSLYAFTSQALGSWEQRPLFKAHLSEPNVLRVGPPWLDVSLLRALPQHFSKVGDRVPMTPAHEGEGRPIAYGKGTTEQQQFDYFKQLRNAGLLATYDDEDLYFVALNSHSVYLTPLGRYFWNRAAEGKI